MLNMKFVRYTLFLLINLHFLCDDVCTCLTGLLVSNNCQEEIDTEEDQLESKSATTLPVLCIEDGSVILKFSEIFGAQEPVRKAKTDQHKRPVNKGSQQAYYKTNLRRSS
mgnify:CR=1 FL=1